jgi:hypothetical protein
MMKRVYIGVIVLCLTVGFGAAIALAQGHVTLSLAEQGLSQRPSVEFDHDPHLAAMGDESCGECHHGRHEGEVKYEAGDEEKPCAECHKVEAEGNMPALMRAYHTNCVGCHRAERKERKETGPVTCGSCHAKQK